MVARAQWNDPLVLVVGTEEDEEELRVLDDEDDEDDDGDDEEEDDDDDVDDEEDDDNDADEEVRILDDDDDDDDDGDEEVRILVVVEEEEGRIVEEAEAEVLQIVDDNVLDDLYVVVELTTVEVELFVVEVENEDRDEDVEEEDTGEDDDKAAEELVADVTLAVPPHGYTTVLVVVPVPLPALPPRGGYFAKATSFVHCPVCAGCPQPKDPEQALPSQKKSILVHQAANCRQERLAGQPALRKQLLVWLRQLAAATRQVLEDVKDERGLEHQEPMAY